MALYKEKNRITMICDSVKSPKHKPKEELISIGNKDRSSQPLSLAQARYIISVKQQSKFISQCELTQPYVQYANTFLVLLNDAVFVRAGITQSTILHKKIEKHFKLHAVTFYDSSFKQAAYVMIKSIICTLDITEYFTPFQVPSNTLRIPLE